MRLTCGPTVWQLQSPQSDVKADVFEWPFVPLTPPSPPPPPPPPLGKRRGAVALVFLRGLEITLAR